MDTKELNLDENSLDHKIIENGDNSFKLWLEFEHFGPWDDLTNTFANVIVSTLKDQRYGINVWTFKYLETARQMDKAIDNSNSYIIPPDLFVEEMTRSCIEKTIKDLLNQGDLEDVLNPTVYLE